MKKIKHIRFFGHFSGDGSYPIVCRELAWFLSRFKTQCNFTLTLENLRGTAFENTPPSDGWARDWADETANLLFGFPTWWLDQRLIYAPAARNIGYHVTDGPIPDMWKTALQERRIDLVLTPSAFSRGHLLEGFYNRPVEIVRHGVSSLWSRKTIDPAYNPSGPLVHFTTSQNGRKGTEILMRIANDLNLAVDVVSSWIGEQAVREKILRARCVVQPSLSEGFGLIPLQAACLGIPVIFTVTDEGFESLTGSDEYAGDLTSGIPIGLSLFAHTHVIAARLEQILADDHYTFAFDQHLNHRWRWDKVLKDDRFIELLLDRPV